VIDHISHCCDILLPNVISTLENYGCHRIHHLVNWTWFSRRRMGPNFGKRTIGDEKRGRQPATRMVRGARTISDEKRGRQPATRMVRGARTIGEQNNRRTEQSVSRLQSGQQSFILQSRYPQSNCYHAFVAHGALLRLRHTSPFPPPN
jgi:hypothetical protein